MDTEGTPLSQLLGHDEPEIDTVETPQVQTAPEPTDTTEPAPEAPMRDERGRFAAKTGVEDAAPPADKLPKEDYKAIREEREKRQNLERELEALKQQFQTLQQPKEPPAPPPTIWEDEQGWQQHFSAQVAQQASFNAKLDMSEMLARQSHQDFDSMKASFLQMAEQNPALAQQALSDPHPWDRAYKIAKNAATMAELGATDVDTLKAKLREEVLAELQQGSQPLPQQQPTIPPTLTTERNVGARTGPAWSGPKPLSELLG